jgi:YidC/Oxa1 family membrane protein insertase
MDRRTLLALTLTAIVIVATPLIFPTPAPPPRVVVDSLADTSGQGAAPTSGTQRAPTLAAQAPQQSTAPQAKAPVVAKAPAVPAESVTVRTNRAEYRLVSPGGVPVAVTLTEYRSLRPGVPKDKPVDLIEPNDRLLHFDLQTGAEMLNLDTVAFRFAPQVREGNTIVQTLTSVSLARPLTLTYRFQVDSFVVKVEGVRAAVAGAANEARLFVSLPARLRSEEADVQEDTRLLAFAWRPGNGEAEGVTFNDLDTLVRADSGALRWVAQRNKYFVIAAIPAERDTAFRMLLMRGEPEVNKQVVMARATAMLPVSDNRFALRVFAGPQSWRHLLATAPELENVNPYGGWLHGAVQPFATIVMRMLLWMRETTNASYGWVLVIFGVAVRLLMWPLNQNAMRSSMKLQRIQPQLAELQTKYKADPEKQREAMMRLYAEHGMSPFTPILGCLPMLLPMPILFALYFVFQNTIEFRGVPFFWLPDLALKDPFYITPLFMGISMYVLSWIGMRGMPPNPQSKMMLYIMPVMFTVLFWNFASGLNLYYAVQNVAALPQQWLLANERVTNASTAKKPGGPKGSPSG